MTEASHDQNNNRAIFLAATLIVLVALGLRVHHLDHASLFMDELHQISFYPYSPARIVDLAAGQQQPPLDYWIGHYVAKVSDSDFFLRLPAALFGVGSVLMLMLLCARLSNWTIALGAGLFLAVSPYHVYFSQDARPYSIAIFFLLTTLWSLDRFLSNKEGTTASLTMFVILTGCFLLSRTLSPLVVCVCLLFLLSGFVLLGHRKVTLAQDFPVKRLWFASIAVLCVLLSYSPLLMNILEKGGRYASNPTNLDLATLLGGLGDFSLAPLWRAYVAQLEPVAYLLLPMLIVCPLVTLKGKPDVGAILVVALLPMAGLLNLLVFQAKTSMPFRPPYAIYLLPLCLVLSALSVHRICNAVPLQWRRYTKISASMMAVILVAMSTVSLIDFKSKAIKTDWKGLSGYLASHMDRHHLLIFDGMHPLGMWEPTFFGFPRYYHGNSPKISIAFMPQDVRLLEAATLEPVLVLFLYRDYLLTDNSIYPIIPSPHKPLDISEIHDDPLLETRVFTGFVTVRLKRKSGRTLKDALLLIERIIAASPQDSTVVDLHLAASALAKKMDIPSWQKHLVLAQQFATDRHYSKVQPTIEFIRNME